MRKSSTSRFIILLPFLPAVALMLAAFMYGTINKWKMDAVVEVYTKSYYHPHLPLSFVVFSFLTAAVIWTVVMTIFLIAKR